MFIRDIRNTRDFIKVFASFKEDRERFTAFEMTFPTEQGIYFATVYRDELTNKNIIPT